MTLLAMILAAGLLAREILKMRATNRLLLAERTQTRARVAASIRRLRRHRDAYAPCLEQAGDEYQEVHERAEELERELAAYRKEDARRDAKVRSARERLN